MVTSVSSVPLMRLTGELMQLQRSSLSSLQNVCLARRGNIYQYIHRNCSPRKYHMCSKFRQLGVLGRLHLNNVGNSNTILEKSNRTFIPLNSHMTCVYKYKTVIKSQSQLPSPALLFHGEKSTSRLYSQSLQERCYLKAKHNPLGYHDRDYHKSSPLSTPLTFQRNLPLLRNHPLFGCAKNTFPKSHQQQRLLSIAKSILDSSPSGWQPYMRLIRFDKPIGTWLLYWPCTWSIALAAQPGCLPDFKMLALFGAGAFFMRGAGCIINDMWDKDFDCKVARTRERPLANGELTHFQALVFLGSQLSISLAILLQLNWYTVFLGMGSMGLVITYPLAKRYTYWPQLVLGLTFNYGALVGWAAVRGSIDWSICLPLYMSCIVWTLVYDTIYAHQDKYDDMLVGVKSTALRLGDQTKPWLTRFTAVMASGLITTGLSMDMPWPYFLGVGLTTARLLQQIYSVNLDDPDQCAQAFRGNFYLGVVMFMAIVAANLMKPKQQDEEKDKQSTKYAVQ